MAPRHLECIQCGDAVSAEDDQTSATCDRCATSYHACRCGHCDDTFVAVGEGRQLCPWCELPSQYSDDRERPFGEVRSPIDAAVSDVPPPVVDATGALEPPTSDDSSRRTRLAGYLTVLALVTAVAGLWLTIAEYQQLSSAHASLREHAIGVVETLGPTVIVVSMLFALAHLVERAADLLPPARGASRDRRDDH